MVRGVIGMSFRHLRRLSHFAQIHSCFRRNWLSDFCPECTSYATCESTAYILVRRKGLRCGMVKG